MSYSWLVHVWSWILGLLSALRVGLLMRGMREFEWQLLINQFVCQMVRFWSWWQNCIEFYCKLVKFLFLWWSVNTNNNYGATVLKQNLYDTDLITCMIHWKNGHPMYNNFWRRQRHCLLFCQHDNNKIIHFIETRLKNTIGVIIKIQMAWLTGRQVISIANQLEKILK